MNDVVYRLISMLGRAYEPDPGKYVFALVPVWRDASIQGQPSSDSMILLAHPDIVLFYLFSVNHVQRCHQGLVIVVIAS